MGTIWACVSGKGGVGKSTAALIFAAELARREKKVALVDADAGVRNLDMLLGVENKIVFDLLDVIEESASLKQATVGIKAVPGLDLLSASQTQEQDAFPDGALERLLKKLKKSYDYVVVDCPTGIGKTVRSALESCDEAVLVTTPDDIAMRDTDHIAGLLARFGRAHPFVLVNRVRPQWVREGLMYSGRTVAQTLDAVFLGEVPEDEAVYRCVLTHQPLVQSECAAVQAMRSGAAVLLGERGAEELPPPKKRSLLLRVFHE